METNQPILNKNQLTGFQLSEQLTSNGLRANSAKLPPQLAFTCLKLTIEALEQGVKYVQSQTVKTPERRQSFWWLYCKLSTYFATCSRVSIVNFEHVIAGWDQKPHEISLQPS